MQSIMSSLKSKKDSQLQKLFVNSFQQNLKLLLDLLGYKEHGKLKLISRGVYYLLVTAEIWLGVKEEVVQQKMVDFDFVEEQPKLIAKEDRNIRIHSLRKGIIPATRAREASNIKEKHMQISMLNELPFRQTQIGFKRLLKPEASKKIIAAKVQSQTYLIDLVQIPKEMSPQQLQPNSKQSWTVNLHRANNLTSLVKRWNQMHHRLFTSIKKSEMSFGSIIKKCTKLDRTVSEYGKLFQSQPYNSIARQLQGADKNLLIDEGLNRVARVFLSGHAVMQQLLFHFEDFIVKTHDIYAKIVRRNIDLPDQNKAAIPELFVILDESLDIYTDVEKKAPSMLLFFKSSLLSVYLTILEQQFSKKILMNPQSSTSFESLTFGCLVKHSEYFEVALQTLFSLLNKLLCLFYSREDLSMSLQLTNLRTYKQVTQHLWNITKYFNKLTKQIHQKRKDSKATIIAQFLAYYEEYRPTYQLFNIKSTQVLQKEVASLKDKIRDLKSAINEDQ